jgi:hypothetical protein
MKTFGELAIGEQFTRGSSDLVWMKNTEFRAYGQFIQNASAVFRHPKIASVWHYDKIADDELVNVVVPV